LSGPLRSGLARLGRLDDDIASLALLLMMLLPLVEIALRPSLGRGVDNAPVLVQHLGLVMAMFGALAAPRAAARTTCWPCKGSARGQTRHLGSRA